MVYWCGLPIIEAKTMGYNAVSYRLADWECYNDLTWMMPRATRDLRAVERGTHQGVGNNGNDGWGAECRLKESAGVNLLSVAPPAHPFLRFPTGVPKSMQRRRFHPFFRCSSRFDQRTRLSP